MEADFWLDKWQRNEIGFHENEVHPLLREYWSVVTADIDHSQSDATNVFVPLCGKSLDMLWLLDQGFDVYGVELSAIGVEAFFTENEIEFTKSADGELTKYQSARVTIWCGDIFALSRSMLPPITLFYDRAALVALAADMREQYINQVASLVNRAARGLLVALEYSPDLITPPPHSLNISTLEKIYANKFSCQLLGSGVGEVKGKPCTEHALLLGHIM